MAACKKAAKEGKISSYAKEILNVCEKITPGNLSHHLQDIRHNATQILKLTQPTKR